MRQTPEMLVVARILQGATAALTVPQVLSIMQVTFPGHELGTVFGMFGAVMGLGAVTGPLLGGLLSELDLFGLGWRPIFLINLPVGVLALVLGRRYLGESKSPHALRLDLVGVVLVVAALLMLLYPLPHGHELNWPVWGYVMMAGSLPLIELSLFKVRSFAAGIVVQLVFGVGLGIFFLVWTLYMQYGLGWSPLTAGATGIPFSIGMSFASAVSVQKLVAAFGRKALQAGAPALAADALLCIWEASRCGTSVSPWQMAPPLFVMGLGAGLVSAPLTASVLSE